VLVQTGKLRWWTGSRVRNNIAFSHGNKHPNLDITRAANAAAAAATAAAVAAAAAAAAIVNFCVYVPTFC